MEENKKSKKEIIKEKIAIYKKERDEYLEALKRERATFLNYKKEEFQRGERQIYREKKELISKILLTLDNFQRAEEEALKRDGGDGIIEGLLKIKDQIESILKEEGVEVIIVEGEEFDPIYHEALETTESESLESGVVAEELQKGYTYKGEVIRPAKVKVVK
jgi:molecular chaperone GrpE